MTSPRATILAVLLLLGCGGSESSLEQARQAQARGDLAAAESAYSDALSSAPDRADVWLARGKARIALGRLDDGLSDLRKAVVLDPDLLEGWRALGVNETKPRDRIAAWDQVLQRRGDDLDARRARGVEHLAAGNTASALEDITRWAAERPDDPEASALQGDALLAHGDPYGAYAAYQRSRSPASRVPRALHPIKVRAREGDGEALTFLTRLGEGTDDYLDVAQTLYDQGRLQPALEEVRKAGVIHKDAGPDRARLLALSAAIREGLLDDPSFAATRGAASTLERGRVYEDVIKECEESLAIAPSALCHRTIGHARLEQRDHAAALTALSAALDLEPGDKKARRWRIEAAAGAERWALVVADVDALELLGVTSVELYIRRGEARARLPDHTAAQARADFDRALAVATEAGRTGPKVFTARKARGLFLAGIGEGAAARDDLIEARTLRPMRDEEIEQALAALGAGGR